MRGWECARCRTVHTQNTTRCRNCEHTVFNTLSEAELRQRASGVDSPEAMEITDDHLLHSAPEESIERSPDVAPDGSIVTESASEEAPERSPGFLARIRALLPF